LKSKKCACNTSSKKNSSDAHWDGVYTKNDVAKLGWYEDESTPNLDLIKACNLNKNDTVLSVGSGATTLIDSLVSLGYTNIIANDISDVALAEIKTRLCKNQSEVSFVVDNLVHPTVLLNLPQVKLWNDRAVLHFFVEESDQKAYFNLLKSKVALGGYVILAEFNLEGATKCSGLPVKRYDASLLADKLGADFKLLKDFDYVYTMPSGDKRNYVYTLFKRVN